MASNFNYTYFKMTRKLLQNCFGSAFREVGIVFIVITIITKFLDSKEMSFINIYRSRVDSDAGTYQGLGMKMGLGTGKVLIHFF